MWAINVVRNGLGHPGGLGVKLSTLNCNFPGLSEAGVLCCMSLSTVNLVTKT